jgi:hypothetical protein
MSRPHPHPNPSSCAAHAHAAIGQGQQDHPRPRHRAPPPTPAHRTGPLHIGGKCDGAKNREIRPKPMVRRRSAVRVRQRASSFCLLSRYFRCLDWQRSRRSVSTQRPPASTVDVLRRSARRAIGSRARVRRGRGGRSGRSRARAWSAVGATGSAFGVLLGGSLTDAFGLEAILLVNLPVGLAVALASARAPPATRAAHRRRVDVR